MLKVYFKNKISSKTNSIWTFCKKEKYDYSYSTIFITK